MGVLGLVPPTCFRRDKGVLEVRTRFHPQHRTFVYTSYLCWNDFMEAPLQETHVTRVSLQNCAHVSETVCRSSCSQSTQLGNTSLSQFKVSCFEPRWLDFAKTVIACQP